MGDRTAAVGAGASVSTVDADERIRVGCLDATTRRVLR